MFLPNKDSLHIQIRINNGAYLSESIESKSFKDMWKEHLSFYVLVTTKTQSFSTEHCIDVFLTLASESNWRIVRVFSFFDIQISPKLPRENPMSFEGGALFGVILTESQLARSILDTTPHFTCQDTETLKIHHLSTIPSFSNSNQSALSIFSFNGGSSKEKIIEEYERLSLLLSNSFGVLMKSTDSSILMNRNEASYSKNELDSIVNEILSSKMVYAPAIMRPTLKSLYFVEYDLMNYKQECFCFVIGVPTEISEEQLNICLKTWTGADPVQTIRNLSETPFVYRVEFEGPASIIKLQEQERKVQLSDGSEKYLWIQPLHFKRDWTAYVAANQTVVTRESPQKEMTLAERNSLIDYIEMDFGRVLDVYNSLEPTSMAITFLDLTKCLRFLRAKGFTHYGYNYTIRKPDTMFPLTGQVRESVYKKTHLSYNRNPPGPIRPPPDYPTNCSIRVKIDVLKNTKSIEQYAHVLLTHNKKILSDQKFYGSIYEVGGSNRFQMNSQLDPRTNSTTREPETNRDEFRSPREEVRSYEKDYYGPDQGHFNKRYQNQGQNQFHFENNLVSQANNQNQLWEGQITQFQNSQSDLNRSEAQFRQNEKHPHYISSPHRNGWEPKGLSGTQERREKKDSEQNTPEEFDKSPMKFVAMLKDAENVLDEEVGKPQTKGNLQKQTHQASKLAPFENKEDEEKSNDNEGDEEFEEIIKRRTKKQKPIAQESKQETIKKNKQVFRKSEKKVIIVSRSSSEESGANQKAQSRKTKEDSEESDWHFQKPKGKAGTKKKEKEIGQKELLLKARKFKEINEKAKSKKPKKNENQRKNTQGASSSEDEDPKIKKKLEKLNKKFKVFIPKALGYEKRQRIPQK